MQHLSEHATDHGIYRLLLSSPARDEDAFWRVVGPWAFDRTIRRELGGPLNHDETYEWILAAAPDGTWAGFSSFSLRQLDQGIVWFDNAYVFAPHRKRGLHAAMFDLRLIMARQSGAKRVKGLATLASRQMFESHGFVIIGERGQYRTYQKDMIDEPVHA